MKTDSELTSDAMRVLRAELGLVEAERFLVLVQRKTFDYTIWRQSQWNDATVADLAEQARQLRQTGGKPPIQKMEQQQGNHDTSSPHLD